MHIPMNIELKNNDIKLLPEYKHFNDAGFDLVSNDEEIIIQPGTHKIINTGIKIDIPSGWEVNIRPRSGLAAKNGITVLNSPGLCDEGYKDEIKVILINLGSEPFVINKYDRIAQGTIDPVYRVKFNMVKKINMNGNRNGGLGSTGITN